MDRRPRFFIICFLGLTLLWVAVPIWAAYKARPWNIGARESYPASLTSERVTIAVEPLLNDALAARVFDKTDIVTRGIMPLAIVIFNDNDFPIEVDGLSIELIHDADHIRTLAPNEVVGRLFRKDKSWLPKMPTFPRSELNGDALEDFDNKFLMEKEVGPHDKGGGFIYLHINQSGDLVKYLSNSIVYIPNVYRQDNGSRMIFFEIGLNNATTPESR
jgi:hypothetical protein